MALESPVNTIYDLVAANPPSGDGVTQGDDHIRNIKTAILASFACGTPGAANWFRVGKYVVQFSVSGGVAASSTAAVTFPVAFGTACLWATASPLAAGANSNNYTASVVQGSLSTTGMTIANNSATSGSVQASWLAIGY